MTVGKRVRSSTGTRFGCIETGVIPFMKEHPECKLFVGLERGVGPIDPETGKHKKKSRVFFVYEDVEGFTREFKIGHETWHEYARPDHPVKVYFDLDDKKKQDGWDELVVKLRDAVFETLPEHKRVMETWIAHTDDKFSAHLIFPEAIHTNPASLHAFAHDMHKKLGNDDRIDMLIYSNNPKVSRCIRMPYCPSVGKQNALVPLDGPSEFDPDRFMRSLISQVGDSPDLITWGSSSVAPRTEAEAEDEDVDPEKMEAMERIKDWLRTYRAAHSIKSKAQLSKTTGKWVWHVSPGLWCPIVKDRHASNNMYVRGTFLDGNRVRIECMCLDEKTCGKRWIEDRDEDWTSIAFSS